jgi:aryl-alcohol dehydrogenase-like predicted oxidoreductase
VLLGTGKVESLQRNLDAANKTMTAAAMAFISVLKAKD